MKFTMLVKSVDPRSSVKDDTPVQAGFDMVEMAREQLKDSRISPRALEDGVDCDYDSYFSNKDADKLPGEKRLSIDVTDMVLPAHAKHFAGHNEVTVYVSPGWTGQYAAILARGTKEKEGVPYSMCKNKKCADCDDYSTVRCSGILFALRWVCSPVSYILDKLTFGVLNFRRQYSSIKIENKLNVRALYMDWIKAGAPKHWNCTPEGRTEKLNKAVAAQLIKGRPLSGNFTETDEVMIEARQAVHEDVASAQRITPLTNAPESSLAEDDDSDNK